MNERFLFGSTNPSNDNDKQWFDTIIKHHRVNREQIGNRRIFAGAGSTSFKPGIITRRRRCSSNSRGFFCLGGSTPCARRVYPRRWPIRYWKLVFRKERNQLCLFKHNTRYSVPSRGGQSIFSSSYIRLSLFSLYSRSRYRLSKYWAPASGAMLVSK